MRRKIVSKERDPIYWEERRIEYLEKKGIEASVTYYAMCYEDGDVNRPLYLRTVVSNGEFKVYATTKRDQRLISKSVATLARYVQIIKRSTKLGKWQIRASDGRVVTIL